MGQRVDHLLQEKLRRRLASVEVKVLNPPRKGKKVVVLDIVSLVCRCERPGRCSQPLCSRPLGH